MCGIAGAIGQIDDSVLRAVRDADAAQTHRGPDGSGFWADAERGVALAHRRLAILDLSAAGAQPMSLADRGTVLVFNGEIYNFAELRRELEADGCVFRSRTDTEVILHAHAKWGADCIRRLRGMFALALWDPRERTALLARDPLGQKPLYYANVPRAGGRAFLFASEIRSLLATGLIDRRIDPSGLATYVWNGYVPGPGSLIRGIVQLPPGHTMIVRADGRSEEPQPYWSLPNATPGTTTVDDVREHMAATVRDHLVADVPVGVFLSGGVDSSAIAALAAKAIPGAVRTFTVGFDDPSMDESDPAARIAAALRTAHHTVPITGNGFLESLPKALASIDQPTFDGLNSYVVSRAVREAGVTVALAGTGGDELFGGYRSFSEVSLGLRWGARIPRRLRQAMATVAGTLYGRGRGVPAQTRWGKLPDVIRASGDALSLYQVRYGLFTERFGRRLLGGTVPADILSGLQRERFADLAKTVAGQPVLHAVSNLELSLFLGDRLLRDTDAAGMAASLEVRLPLVDHGLIETVAGLNEADRFSPLGRKQFLRTHILGNLDPALFDRPKRGFEMPFDRWLRGPLFATVDPVLRDGQCAKTVGLDPTAVSSLWNAFLERKRGLYWSRVWGLFTLMNWCQRHRVTM